MFWLFNINTNTNANADTNKFTDEYKFLQIFKSQSIIIDNNTIYKIGEDSDNLDNLDNSDNSDNLDNNFKIDNIDIETWISNNLIEKLEIEYQIKIMGNIISYHNLKTNQIITFLKKEKVIEYTKNKNKLVFEIEYKIIDNHKLPELISSSYDYFYNKIKFSIYKINNNIMYIKEINKSNNSFRKYLITQNNGDFYNF